MGNQNRKATKCEMDRVRRVIKDAYPDLAPVVWRMPDQLRKLTASNIRSLVEHRTGSVDTGIARGCNANV